ncbi:MAG TPA: 6-phosphogluconolactonase [Terriglobales bacterium]|jgi:6-phosphogluconolactonase|nr:6-phosphogluconolactonase [Terriglobales bacterium]
MASKSEVRVLNAPADLFQAAAAEFSRLANEAVRARGRFCVALSGGSTPKSLFALLASGAVPSIPWDKICFFFGDERHVPPDHPDSNYRMANEAMLSKVPLRPENVFRVRAEEKDAAVAAQAYEQTLISFFHLSPGEFPRFDLVLLGMGPDGHTASLFPGSRALQEKSRLVVSNWVEKFKTDRITVTFPVINHAAFIMFMVSGPDKAQPLHEVLENSASDLPSRRVQPVEGTLLWLVDRAAATALSTQAMENFRTA